MLENLALPQFLMIIMETPALGQFVVNEAFGRNMDVHPVKIILSHILVIAIIVATYISVVVPQMLKEQVRH